jgi:hypothetical protein
MFKKIKSSVQSLPLLFSLAACAPGGPGSIEAVQPTYDPEICDAMISDKLVACLNEDDGDWEACHAEGALESKNGLVTLNLFESGLEGTWVMNLDGIPEYAQSEIVIIAKLFKVPIEEMDYQTPSNLVYGQTWVEDGQLKTKVVLEPEDQSFYLSASDGCYLSYVFIGDGLEESGVGGNFNLGIFRGLLN